MRSPGNKNALAVVVDRQTRGAKVTGREDKSPDYLIRS